MTFVVDTNVPIVANGADWLQKAPECVIACDYKLKDVMDSGRVALDDGWQIVKEYTKHLRRSGEPGAGDKFFKWVLTNIRNPQRCDLVQAAEFPDDPRLAGFDRSDRKFVCVAPAHPDRPSILYAVERHWNKVVIPLSEHGIIVDCICTQVP